jgi:hypothetical protein
MPLLTEVPTAENKQIHKLIHRYLNKHHCFEMLSPEALPQTKYKK